MPKRSNPFQRLIKTIYAAMAHVEEGKVTESASLHEPDGTPREIDVLLEARVYGHALRIAVECRDRSRKGDVEWVDGLIGKYRNLDVNKVIAVSRSGFSKAAASKAKAGGIETRTVKQCVDADWSGEFVRIGLGQFAISPHLQEVAFELSPSRESELSFRSVFENHEGRSLGSVSLMVSDCFTKAALPKIKEFIDKQFLPSCRVLADLKRKIQLIVPVDMNNVVLRAVDGSTYELKKLTYTVVMQGTVETAKVEHYQYGKDAQVAVATLRSPEATHVVVSFKWLDQNNLVLMSKG